MDKETLDASVETLYKILFIICFIIGYIKSKREVADDWFNQQEKKESENTIRKHYYDI